VTTTYYVVSWTDHQPRRRLPLRVFDARVGAGVDLGVAGPSDLVRTLSSAEIGEVVAREQAEPTAACSATGGIDHPSTSRAGR
jgi:hypothetical protein